MHSIAWLLIACGSLAVAAPSSGNGDWYNGWVPPVQNYFEAVGKHVSEARDTGKGNWPTPSSCDLSKAQMPVAPTALPNPSAGLQLVHVAIGRGTQNYSCADNSSTTYPTSNGALAKLYNATCTAANYPDLVAMMPELALQFTQPAANATLQPSSLVYLGEHYFRDNSTPTFDLDTARYQLGCSYEAKNASSPAPADAPKGPAGQGYGAVAWLKLVAKPALKGTGAQEVYRLNTAGGAPPPNCAGMGAQFTVDYAAEYWFWE